MSQSERLAFIAHGLRHGHTLEEIGTALSLTRERVRQIAKRAGITDRARFSASAATRALRRQGKVCRYCLAPTVGGTRLCEYHRQWQRERAARQKAANRGYYRSWQTRYRERIRRIIWTSNGGKCGRCGGALPSPIHHHKFVIDSAQYGARPTLRNAKKLVAVHRQCHSYIGRVALARAKAAR